MMGEGIARAASDLPPARRHGAARRLASGSVLALLGLVAVRKKRPDPDARFDRIMLFRFGGIGDCIVVSGLIRSLRARFPRAHITVATVAACREVFRHNPDIDEFVIGVRPMASFDPARTLAHIRALRRWSATPYDLCVFTHGGFSDMLLAPLFRARNRVGFDFDGRGFDFPLTHSAVNRTDARRELSDQFHDLLRAVVGPLQPSAPRLCLTDAERDAARAWLADQDAGPHPVAIALGGTANVKMWPVARFAALARRIGGETGRAIVVIGGPSEAHLAGAFAEAGPRVRFAAGAFTLRESFAVIAEAAALVSCDTGMMHAGAALGVKLVALFGPTTASVYGYAGPGRERLAAAMGCVPCEAEACRLLAPAARARGETSPCMAALTVDQVMAALGRALGKGGRR